MFESYGMLEKIGLIDSTKNPPKKKNGDQKQKNVSINIEQDLILCMFLLCIRALMRLKPTHAVTICNFIIKCTLTSDV